MQYLRRDLTSSDIPTSAIDALKLCCHISLESLMYAAPRTTDHRLRAHFRRMADCYDRVYQSLSKDCEAQVDCGLTIDDAQPTLLLDWQERSNAIVDEEFINGDNAGQIFEAERQNLVALKGFVHKLKDKKCIGSISHGVADLQIELDAFKQSLAQPSS